VDPADLARLERLIDREVKARFGRGTVSRATVVAQGGDQDELVVRVFANTGAGSLDEWAHAHQVGMTRLRRELSLRLPEASVLEFTVEDPGDASRITLPHDPAVLTETLPPREIVMIALSLLRSGYIFPDLAERAAAQIGARADAGEYDELGDEALAERLTSQLHEICDDKHLRVRTMPPPGRGGPAEPDGPPPQIAPGAGQRPRSAPRPAPGSRPPTRMEGRPPHNYGIRRVERLDGNGGYLDIRAVAAPHEAGPVIAAAMELIAGTYALSSAETFSGGEDFCYTLQAQGRAEVIGETTGGGAHPTRMIPISATMGIAVPFARSVNPVTGTNWQGTGVVPDTPVPADQAYEVAYAKALRHVLTLQIPPPVAAEANISLDELSASSSQ
jgi:hypothetical protein